MIDLVGLIRRVVRAELAVRAMPPALGVVEAVHLPDAGGTAPYACDVRLQGTEAVHAAVPVMTGHLGTLTPPTPGDVAVLAHLDADPDQPVIVGFVWSDTVPAPEVGPNAHVRRVPHSAAPPDRIETRQTAGTNGARTWSVDLPEGPRLEVTDTTVTARLEGQEVVLDGAAGTVTVRTGAAHVTVDAAGAVRIAGDGDIAIEAGANLTLSAGANAEIRARGTMALSAARIDLN